MSGPKILLIDIETAPDVALVWGVYKTNAIAIKEHWYLLSYAAKWFGEAGIVCEGLDDHGQTKLGTQEAERRLLGRIWILLNGADIVVAHNGRSFDVKKLNARFIKHKMQPPTPYYIVDTKEGLKEAAYFTSNKLDWVGDDLGLGRKIKHEGVEMWIGCMNGVAKWWKKMKRYNRHDIVLLERLYKRIAPWIKQPNAAMWGRKCINPACRSKRVHSNGIRRNRTRAYVRFRCADCGKSFRSSKSLTQPRATVTPIGD